MSPPDEPGVSSTSDLHIHTNYSDGYPSPQAVLAHVQAMGHPRIIAITDHNTIEGAVQAAALAPRFGVAVIVGEEVSSQGGHILGLFLEERVPPGLSAAETIAAIHRQGGIAIAPHPFYRARRSRGTARRPAMESVHQLAGELPFDAIEVINGTPFLGPANRRAQQFNRTSAWRGELGSSDAHILAAIGKAYTQFPGETAADLRCAILNGTTAARAQRYRVPELLRYGRFWLRLSLAHWGPAW